ncbi:unnamed protein product [Tenebrio molitor]|nr:unnamed protein product [Tenebrio molitor]
MEKTRYGVKTSILEELKSFQLELKKRRRMLFEVTVTGNVGPPVSRTLMTGEGRASIVNVTYPCLVRREDYSDQSETEITLIIHKIMKLKVKFQSSAHKRRFKSEISGEWTPSPPKET